MVQKLSEVCYNYSVAIIIGCVAVRFSLRERTWQIIACKHAIIVKCFG